MITINPSEIPVLLGVLQRLPRLPLRYSLRVAKLGQELESAHAVWREEYLAPAIREDYPDTETVPEAEVRAFMASHPAVFDQVAEVNFTPLKVGDLPDDLALLPVEVAALLELGVLTEE